MIGVNSGDGNDIFSLAKRIQRMGLEELRKTPPDELRQNIASGLETGSSKWLSDFNSFYGSANQLMVKVSGTMNIDDITESEVDAKLILYAEERKNEREAMIEFVNSKILYKEDGSVLKTITKRVIEIDKIIEDTEQIEDKMERYFRLNVVKDVWWNIHPIPATGKFPKEKLEYLLENLRTDILKKTLGSKSVTEQKLIFKTLNKKDSSIANLIQQLTSSQEALLVTLKSKMKTWRTEISDDKLEALKTDADTIKKNFIKTNGTPEISNYQNVFDRLTNKYDDLYRLIRGIDSGSTKAAQDRPMLSFNPNQP
jgi:hypothetical protein